MDMQITLDFNENYPDPNAEIWVYTKALGLTPKGEGYSGPKGIREYLKRLKIKKADNNFLYTTPITDLCNWVLTRVKGKPLGYIFEEEIYSKIGAEREAMYTVDDFGTEAASGGLAIILRDMARVGKLLLNKGMYKGNQILPREIFDGLENLDKTSYLERYGTSLQSKQPGKADWYYKNQIWWMNSEDEDYSAIEIHGQIMYINPKQNIVVIKQASHNRASEPLLGYQNTIIQEFISKI